MSRYSLLIFGIFLSLFGFLSINSFSVSAACQNLSMNQCALFSTKCSDNSSGYYICGDPNADDCLEWADFIACDIGKACSAGECVNYSAPPNPNSGGGGGGSGGGGGGVITCTPNWTCSWGDCVGGRQTQRCTDTKRCGTNFRKPVEQNRTCAIEPSCIDNDNDGYGTGEGCLGADLDDNDSSITTRLPAVKKKFDLGILLYGGGILAVIVLLILIIFLVKRRKRNSYNPYSQINYSNLNKENKPINQEKEELIEKAEERVREMRSRGYSEDNIIKSFIDKGWSDEDIKRIMNNI